MMLSRLNRQRNDPAPPNEVRAARVLGIDASRTHEDPGLRLDDGRCAQPAASCLIRPGVGDTVAVIDVERRAYIVAVLERPGRTRVVVEVPRARHVTIAQEQLDVVATGRLGLKSAGDIDLISATGRISIAARNLFTSVHRCLVQTAQHWIGRSETSILQSSGLMRVHGQQGMITAEGELKLDGERITMG